MKFDCVSAEAEQPTGKSLARNDVLCTFVYACPCGVSGHMSAHLSIRVSRADVWLWPIVMAHIVMAHLPIRVSRADVWL